MKLKDMLDMLRKEPDVAKVSIGTFDGSVYNFRYIRISRSKVQTEIYFLASLLKFTNNDAHECGPAPISWAEFPDTEASVGVSNPPLATACAGGFCLGYVTRSFDLYWFLPVGNGMPERFRDLESAKDRLESLWAHFWHRTTTTTTTTTTKDGR